MLCYGSKKWRWSIQWMNSNPRDRATNQHQRVEGASRKRRLRGKSPSGKTNRQPCRDFLKSSCTKLPCDKWHPPECQFCKSESGCKFGKECSFPHWKVEEQPNESRRRGGNTSTVAIVTQVQVVIVRRVRFTRTVLCQANIRENRGPSLNKTHVKLPHQRSPYAMKFEDRSQEENERQERCARRDAWRLAKKIYKLQETEKATS